MASPFARSRSSSAKRISTSGRERLLVGSSRTSTLASSTRARAISTICRSATESEPTAAPGAISGCRSSASAAAAPRFMASRSSRPQRVGSMPRKTFSATLRWGASASSWCTSTTPRSRASRAVRGRKGSPASSMTPASGAVTPERIPTSVLFPAPFSPTSAWTRPGASESSTSVSAWVAPKRLSIPVARRRGAGVSVIGRSPGASGRPRSAISSTSDPRRVAAAPGSAARSCSRASRASPRYRCAARPLPRGGAPPSS